MKRILLILAAIVPMAVMAVSPGGEQLKVASYNIRLQNDGDSLQGDGWAQRLPHICKLIMFHDFDIFGAQEVLPEQMEDLRGALPGYTGIGVGREDGKSKGEHTPIFYKTEKFELLDWGHFWLSENTEEPSKGWDAALPRICTWAKFKSTESGRPLWFFNTHFDHVGETARLKSAELIGSRIRELAGREAFVMTGDFNVAQGSEPHMLMAGMPGINDAYTWAKMVYVPSGTFTGFDPAVDDGEIIDHIFVSDDILVERFGVLTDTYRTPATQSAPFNYREVIRIPSDHYPVVANIVF